MSVSVLASCRPLVPGMRFDDFAEAQRATFYAPRPARNPTGEANDHHAPAITSLADRMGVFCVHLQACWAQAVIVAQPKGCRRIGIQRHVLTPALAGATAERAAARSACLLSNDNRWTCTGSDARRHYGSPVHKLDGRAVLNEVDHAQGARIQRHSKQISLRDTKGARQNQPRHTRVRHDRYTAPGIGRYDLGPQRIGSLGQPRHDR